MEHMGAHDSPSKYLQVGLPESNHANGNVTSPRNDSSTSLSSKMKRMLSSPKVTRGKAAPSPNRTFGVTLDFLNDRDKTEVPLIVSRICDYLKMHGLKQEGLFRVNGNMKVVERLKNAFDKCGDADLEETGDVPAAASLLKMFLRELSEPVIPDNMQPVFIQIQDQYCKEKDKAIPLFKELVKRMPSANAHLLKYLCTFMLTISDGSETNKMTPLALAIVFGPNIFRCGEGLEGLKDQAYVNAVLLALLQEHEEIFLIDNAMFKDSKPRSVPEKPVAYYDTKKMKKDGSSQSIPEPPLHLGSNLSSEDRMDKSPRRSNSASSPKRTTSSNRRSPRHDSVRAQRTNSAKKRNQTEPERSRSPSSYTHLSSPLSKQLVNNTISSTVKEHLFGPGMLISSTESIETNDRTHESAGGDDSHELAVYPSVMERVKKFSMDSPTHPNVTPTPNKKPKPSSKNSLKKTRSGPTPIQPSMSNVTDKDLDFIQTSGRQPLQSLTHRRAPSQKRRPPSINRRSAARESTSSDDYRETRRPSVGNTSSTPQQGDTIYSLPNKNQPNKREPMTPSMERLELQQKRDDQITGRNHNTMNERQEQEISPGELKKRISSLKRVISNFENEFMETNGRKPKPSEKAQIQKYIAELGRAKQQHKELVTDYKTNTQHVMDVDQDLGGPQLRDIIDRDGEPTKEQTLNNLLRRLEEKRSSIGRAHEILAMSNEQLKEEKLAVQKALLQYENIHGRPSSKEDKTLMRPIYDRYRKIKRLIAAYKDDGTIEEQDSNIKTIYQSDNNEVSDFGRSRDRANSTTPENVLTDDQTPHQHIMDDSTLPGDTFSVTNRLQYTPEPFSPTPLESLQNFDESVLHNASMSELMEQLKETKSSKKKLGKTLKDFEDEFYLANDRKVQKEDRLPHEAEYREYKLIKAKLRLLEALISKRKTGESF